MYNVLLVIHSYWRWVVVGLGLAVLVRAAVAWRGHRPWSVGDGRVAGAFMGTLDLQFLLGIVMWWLSPYGYLVRASFMNSMKNPLVRFWGLEHPLLMLLGVFAAHIGNTRAKLRGDGWQRQRTMVIALVIWAALVLAAFPYPGLVRGRPLLRM